MAAKKTLGVLTLGIFFSSIGISMPVFSCNQSDAVAKIEKTEGMVKYQRYQAIKTKTVRHDEVNLCSGDKVITLEDGRAKITTSNKHEDVYVLDTNATLTVNSLEGVGISTGNALFMIEKRKQSSSFQVKTKFSTIGVKGTEFLVTQYTDIDQVAMSEGRVEVLPLQEAFNLYEKRQLAAYEAYQKQQVEAFQSMKDSIMAEFNKFQEQGKNYIAKGSVKKVGLAAGQTLSISGKKAILDKQVSKQALLKIEELKAFAH